MGLKLIINSLRQTRYCRFVWEARWLVLMSEQPGLDTFVDGNCGFDGTLSGLAHGFILTAQRACIISGTPKKNSPKHPPDPDLIYHGEPALCWSQMPGAPLLCCRGCSLLSDPLGEGVCLPVCGRPGFMAAIQ